MATVAPAANSASTGQAADTSETAATDNAGGTDQTGNLTQDSSDAQDSTAAQDSHNNINATQAACLLGNTTTDNLDSGIIDTMTLSNLNLAKPLQPQPVDPFATTMSKL